MLPNHSPSPAEAASAYEGLAEDCYAKLKGVFQASLQKVLTQVHPNLAAGEDALECVEGLILKLLAMLTSKPSPSSVQDVEERVRKTFPTPIDRWALSEAQTAVGKGRKKSDLVLPVDKVHLFLTKEVLQNRLDEQVTVYIVAVLEYISADILKLTGNYIKQIRHLHISAEDIKVAIRADKALMDMFYQGDVLYIEEQGGYIRNRTVQTYDEVVKDLILCEKSYLRDLHMITKVFRDHIQKSELASSQELDAIFSNITDIAEFTMTLIGSLEDTLEMAEDGQITAIGPCFEELAEAEEFAVYEKYARDVLSPDASHHLELLLKRPEVAERLTTSGHGFREAVKFYLPKLLLGPVFHCFHYFKYIELLTELTPYKDDRDSLKQVAAMLSPLHNELSSACSTSGLLGGPGGGGLSGKRKTSDVFYRYGPGRQSRQQSLVRLNQLQQSIVGWEGKDIVANSSEIVYEGKLKVGTDRRKVKDRYVILCDGLMIVCSQQSGTRRPSSSAMPGPLPLSHSSSGELRYRDKYLIRLINIVDREDDDTLKHSFELCQRDQQRVIFKCETAEEKNGWMAALVMLNTKSMLERTLDVILTEEEKKHPLRLPDPSLYRFSELDSPTNIVFEEREKSSGVPLIKGATLLKLVERLTYHVYATPIFMKTFLTTYRSFCTPMELLALLIERFHIPDPEFPDTEAAESDQSDKSRKMRCAQDLKRFRKEYAQPVQFRVLNVLKHWVDQHFCDFSEDCDLLHRLTTFLDEIPGKSMRKWVECISKVVQRRLDSDESQKEILFNFDRSPPPIEIHIKSPQEDWPQILTFHPIEIARQLTLIEFQYYRAVKPSELVDLAWTREDKDKRSPNLLRMVRHTTNFTRYLEKMILETENMEERVAIMQRVLEVMVVLQECNNFNGVLAITSALNSSAVHRLTTTKDKLPGNLLKSLEDATSLVADHFKLYLEKLRSINPPCVPFFGQYQTNILFLEEGNPDFLHNSELINFSKRRKVAEIISEIQQYQNQPYCLSEYPKLRDFLRNLDPFKSFTETEVRDYLWDRSVEIEPRSSSDTIKRRNGERRWPGLSLKSPGIKPRTLPGKNPPHPLPKISSGGSAAPPAAASYSSRQGKDDASSSSPLNSPSFGGSPSQVMAAAFPRQSPVSTPLTPGQMSPRDDSSSAPAFPRDDPIKISVILPTGPVSGSVSATAAATTMLPPPGKPPPLPPKPRGGGNGGGIDHTPPLPPPRDVSPPPPLPPRLIAARGVPPPSSLAGGTTGAGYCGGPSGSSFYMSSKPPFESRHPLIEPVFPRRNASLDSASSSSSATSSLPPLVPRSRNNTSGGGEPSPSTAAAINNAAGAAPPFRWASESPSTSPHYHSRHHHPHPPPPPPPSITSGGDRVGSAPVSASWEPARPSPSSAAAAVHPPAAAASVGGGPPFFNGPVSAGLEVGSHFVFGHHLQAPAGVSSTTGQPLSPYMGEGSSSSGPVPPPRPSPHHKTSLPAGFYQTYQPPR